MLKIWEKATLPSPFVIATVSIRIVETLYCLLPSPMLVCVCVSELTAINNIVRIKSLASSDKTEFGRSD